MTLGRLRKGLRRALRRPPGRWLAGVLLLALAATGFPRLEAHAHAQGEHAHATIIHQGPSLDHDHHAGHGHADESHDGHAPATDATGPVQHVHLMPHAVALPADPSLVPVVRAVPKLRAPPLFIAPTSRPEEVFRPPIR